jgi:hypothetical protein
MKSAARNALIIFAIFAAFLCLSDSWQRAALAFAFLIVAEGLKDES